MTSYSERVPCCSPADFSKVSAGVNGTQRVSEEGVNGELVNSNVFFCRSTNLDDDEEEETT